MKQQSHRSKGCGQTSKTRCTPDVPDAKNRSPGQTLRASVCDAERPEAVQTKADAWWSSQKLHIPQSYSSLTLVSLLVPFNKKSWSSSIQVVVAAAASVTARARGRIDNSIYCGPARCDFHTSHTSITFHANTHLIFDSNTPSPSTSDLRSLGRFRCMVVPQHELCGGA